MHNGLGLIEKASGEYPRAVAHFREALDHWVKCDYGYGVAAVFANVGGTLERWGDSLRRHGAPWRGRFEAAVPWLERCLDLSRLVGQGGDTCDAELSLARARLALGQVDEALAIAEAAVASAEATGNALDRQEAAATLAAVRAARAAGEGHARCSRGR